MATYVLVHGAFDGGWCFQRVARLLRQHGHEVHAPTLTGCGDRSHLLSREICLETYTTDVLSMLEHEDLVDVVLVGHSYGGAVISMVADRVPERLRRVVFFDALAPEPGQSASGQTTATDILHAMAGSDEWLLPPIPLESIGVVTPDDVAFVGPRRHPHPVRTLHEPLSLQNRPATRALKRAYLACTQHSGLIALFGVDPLQPSRERALREGWQIDTLDAPHAAMITHPDRVAAALLVHAE